MRVEEDSSFTRFGVPAPGCGADPSASSKEKAGGSTGSRSGGPQSAGQGPAALPVEPAEAIRWPAATASPTATASSLQWA